MKINFEFLPQGAKLTVSDDYFEYSAFNNTQKWLKENTLILDTGNLLMAGVIDHHQPIPEVAESCVTSIVVRDAEKYIGHLKNLEEVNIITHFIPDLDATALIGERSVATGTRSFGSVATGTRPFGEEFVPIGGGDGGRGKSGCGCRVGRTGGGGGGAPFDGTETNADEPRLGIGFGSPLPRAVSRFW